MTLLSLWLLAAVNVASSVHPTDDVLPHVGAACVACVPEPGQLGDLTTQEWIALQAGEVVKQRTPAEASDGANVALSRADYLIHHSPAEVWSVLTDFTEWPRFMPLIDSTSITRREGPRQWVRQEYSVLFTGLEHTTIYELDPGTGRLAWTLDPESPRDIHSSAGSWELHPIEGGTQTLVRYVSRVDTGRPLPRIVENLLFDRSLDQMLQKLRAEISRRAELRVPAP